VNWSNSGGHWTENSGDIYRSTGDVGIGTNTPSGILEVSQAVEYYNELIDQQQTSHFDYYYTGSDIWQSFTSGISGYLTKISIYVGSATSGSFVWKVYDGQGTGGTLLATSDTLNRISGYNYVYFDNVTIPVIAGQQYTFAIEYSGSWSLSYQNNNLYSGGVLFFGGYIRTSYDTKFKTYVASSLSRAPASFTVHNNGNVGIGTTSPSQKLEVNGAVKIGAYTLPSTDGTNGLQLTTDGSGNVTWSNSSGLWTENSGNIYKSSGKVGIGTSSPADSKLHIEGSGIYDGMMRLNNTGTSGASFFMGSTNSEWTVGDSLFIMGHGSPSSANTDLVITSDGDVGIGTSTPNHALDLGDALGAKLAMYQNTTGNAFFGFGISNNTLEFHAGSTTGATAEAKMVVNGNGYVGIGTTSPGFPLEVSGYVSQNYSNYGYLTDNGAGTQSPSSDNWVSIKAEQRVVANKFTALSDERIKTNIKSSNSKTDLKKVNQLNIVDYNYIDKPSKGTQVEKGVIAQEVEYIIPEAVNIHSEIIPDIFVTALEIKSTGENTLIEISKEHNLQKGDMLRLITKSEQLETEVVEILSKTCFAVKLEQTPESIFVYGKKVDDFRAVNYDYIFSTGIGAIQELSKQNEKLRSEIESLKSLKSDVEELKALFGQIAENN